MPESLANQRSRTEGWRGNEPDASFLAPPSLGVSDSHHLRDCTLCVHITCFHSVRYTRNAKKQNCSSDHPVVLHMPQLTHIHINTHKPHASLSVLTGNGGTVTIVTGLSTACPTRPA